MCSVVNMKQLDKATFVKAHYCTENNLESIKMIFTMIKCFRNDV